MQAVESSEAGHGANLSPPRNLEERINAWGRGDACVTTTQTVAGDTDQRCLSVDSTAGNLPFSSCVVGVGRCLIRLPTNK